MVYASITTENEYQKILSRVKIHGASTDYVRVNGQTYVMSVTSEPHGVLSQRSGAARYTTVYYSVLAAVALMKLYGRGREVVVFGSHAPSHVKFREDLMRSVIGGWEVEIGSSKSKF